MWISNRQIADSLGISRQAVGKHRRNGMPGDSIESAQAWYASHVGCSRRKGRVTHYTKRDAVRAIFLPPDETASILASFNNDSLDEVDFNEPLTLDDYPPGFWGVDASASIARILLGNSKQTASGVEVLAIFHCIQAAMRRHLRDMPERMAARIGGPNRQRIEDALYEWIEMFCAHWHGSDFRDDPMLPKDLTRLEDFYRPITEDRPPLRSRPRILFNAAQVGANDRSVRESNPRKRKVSPAT